MLAMLRPTLILVLAFGLAGKVASGERVDLSDHPWIGETAPGFDLENVAGDSLKLEDLRGSFVVIHFGASW